LDPLDFIVIWEQKTVPGPGQGAGEGQDGGTQEEEGGPALHTKLDVRAIRMLRIKYGGNKRKRRNRGKEEGIRERRNRRKEEQEGSWEERESAADTLRQSHVIRWSPTFPGSFRHGIPYSKSIGKFPKNLVKTRSTEKTPNKLRA
jgi:hypothetical protein